MPPKQGQKQTLFVFEAFATAYLMEDRAESQGTAIWNHNRGESGWSALLNKMQAIYLKLKQSTSHFEGNKK